MLHYDATHVWGLSRHLSESGGMPGILYTIVQVERAEPLSESAIHKL
jgi:hypothetical protein